VRFFVFLDFLFAFLFAFRIVLLVVLLELRQYEGNAASFDFESSDEQGDASFGFWWWCQNLGWVASFQFAIQGGFAFLFLQAFLLSARELDLVVFARSFSFHTNSVIAICALGTASVFQRDSLAGVAVAGAGALRTAGAWCA
jgi:hypothetical protein